MKKLLITLMMLTAGFTATAQEKKNKNARHAFEVKGNCEQCKKRIEKAAFGVSGVKSAVWDMEEDRLSIILNEEKASLKQVQEAIAKAGHDNEGATATDAAYDGLHHCCKYERTDD